MFAILFVLLILLAATRETAISVLFIGIVVIFYFALLWSQIAVSIKRVHDRDWPWPFILLLFVPLLQFWPMIEIMFLPGTVGGNRFGPDPVTRR